VLEELVRRFDPRIALAALAASGSAIAVASVLIGQAPDFRVAPIPFPAVGSAWIFGLLGVVAGLAGMAYNVAILRTLTAIDRLRNWPIELRAAVIGAVV